MDTDSWGSISLYLEKLEDGIYVYSTASAIDYTLRVWCKNGDYWTVNGQVRENIRESFAKHGVEMTYNHVNVHMMKD